VNKLNLAEMEAPDMLDVVHYFLDEDMRYTSPEEIQLHEVVRKTLMVDLYERKYNYGNNKDAESNLSPDVKPYIPPTEVDPDAFNPFGQVLDAPLV
jgi:hypothetical protein